MVKVRGGRCHGFSHVHRCEPAGGPERCRRFDGSASAGAALEWAIDEARLHAVPVRVCIAADVPDVTHVRACAERIVAGRNAELGGEVRADFRVDPGAAAEVLCEACGAGDLLVVSGREVAIPWLVYCWARSARRAWPARRARSSSGSLRTRRGRTAG
ncbi:hypothetical protein JCM10369A_44100 [Nocardioides pyridinolyticus]